MFIPNLLPQTHLLHVQQRPPRFQMPKKRKQTFKLTRQAPPMGEQKPNLSATKNNPPQNLNIRFCPTHMDTPHTFIGSPLHSMDPKTYNRPAHLGIFIGSPPHSMDPKAHDRLTHMGTSNALTSTHTPHNTGFPLQPNTEPLFPLYTPCPVKTRPKSTLVPSKWKE